MFPCFKQEECGPSDFEDKARFLKDLRYILQSVCSDVELTITITIVIAYTGEDLDRYLNDPNRLLGL